MMKPLAAFLLACLVPPASAGEDWQKLYEDGAISVSVDAASLSRRGQNWVFRERELMREPQLDPASMRRIREIRFLRQADCAAHRLNTLSRAEFSEHGVMVHYEARRAEEAAWDGPRSGRELRLLLAVCGPA